MTATYRKKLIEAALPLKAINQASAREKEPFTRNHPRSLHIWWARRPLAACRAVLFASLVDDPDSDPAYRKTDGTVDEDRAGVKRAQLFNLIEELVQWENSNNPRVINAARAEIARCVASRKMELGELKKDDDFRFSISDFGLEGAGRSRRAADASVAENPKSKIQNQKSCKFWDFVKGSVPRAAVNAFLAEHAPPVLDPFCGGGSIPLEAQRLGLRAYASDLNPVPVLITKALIEIPPKFADRPPVNPEARKKWGVKRKEGEDSTLSRDDRLAEGDASGARALSAGAETSEGGDVRNAVADHAGHRLNSGEHRGGMGARVDEGEGPVPGDRAGIARGGGNAVDSLRADRMVSADRDRKSQESARRSQPNPDEIASEASPAVASSLPSHSSFLFSREWQGAQGLAEDVRYYGQWMCDEAEKRIGHLYPKVKITKEMAEDRPDLKDYVGQELTVIAWMWARTVKCPNPACGARAPLVRSFWVSTKKGRACFAEPQLNRAERTLRFRIRTHGEPPKHTTDRNGGRCLFCDRFIKKGELRDLSIAHGLGEIPFAIVAEGTRNRVYLDGHSLPPVMIETPEVTFLEQPMTNDRRWFSPPLYGMPHFADLFTPRQLVALTTFSDLVQEARAKVLADAERAGRPADERPLSDGGTGPQAYADAIATYLAFAVDKSANYWSTLCGWHSGRDIIMSTFARQALPMVWDYAEGNPISDSTGNFSSGVEQAVRMFCGVPAASPGETKQLDATAAINGVERPMISTDPPYYHNIGYADLSDFFYVWLRRSLKDVHPSLFATALTPKAQELIASPYRHEGDKHKAQEFFETGLGQAFARMHEAHVGDYSLTVYYAFKQTETDEDGGHGDSPQSAQTASTGWETMLAGLIRSGFAITGTWPMRTELVGNLKKNVSALASSIVLVCRPRLADARLATRKEFMNALRQELPEALKSLQHGNIASVDMAQAAIGPGMAVFTRYSKVIESDGSPMTVRTALGIINQVLDEVLAEQEGDFDADTRWALAWFDQHGMDEGPFGVAETLSKAKNTAVNGLVEAGVVKARGGKVRLVKREELPASWDPATDQRLTVWETTQHLIRTLQTKGESEAATLLNKLGGLGETARELAYRLYAICERKKWADEALAYNSLVIAWPELSKLALSSRNRQSASQRDFGF